MQLYPDYSKEKVKQELETRLSQHERSLEFLKTIKRKKKKDGTDFKNLIQNFEGKIRHDNYNSEFLDYFYIWYGDAKVTINKYTSDEKFVAEHPDRVVDRWSYLKPIVYYNADEIMELINERIEREELKIQAINSNLRELDKIWDWLIEKLEPLVKYIEQFESKDMYNNEPIYYPMREQLKQMF